MNKIETSDVYEDFGICITEYLALVIILLNQDFMIIQTLVVGKMKDETTGLPIKEFVGLKPKMYSLLVDDCSEQQK